MTNPQQDAWNAAVEAAIGFMRHGQLCGIVGGYGYCTCGMEQAQTSLRQLPPPASISGGGEYVMVPRERLDQFTEALFGLRWAAERVMGGQQFNAYDSAENDDDDGDEDCKMILALGPVSDARWIGECVGRDQAAIVESALKFATVAMLAAAQPSAGGEEE